MDEIKLSRGPLAMDTEPRWGSAINFNGVMPRQNPLVFFVTFVVHFRWSRPSLEAKRRKQETLTNSLITKNLILCTITTFQRTLLSVFSVWEKLLLYAIC